MKGYLLDTNHVHAWERKTPSFMERLRRTPPEDLLRVSAVTLGELECGHRITTDADPDRRRESQQFIVREIHPYVLSLTLDTRDYYAEIVERIWRRHQPHNRRVRTEAHLVTLGVDINDVWIVATASQHNLTLLTTDEMKIIREAVPDVRFETWI